MTGEPDFERLRVLREVRQRLEALRRAGLSDLPSADLVACEGPIGHGKKSEAHVPLEVEALKPPISPISPSVPEITERPSRGFDTTINPPQPPAEATSPHPSAPAPSSAPISRPATPPPLLPAASLFEEPGFDSPPVPPGERLAVLKALATEVSLCRKCTSLAESRTQTVFSDGSPNARLMFIGEAPGAEEDRTGVPFVGRAGQLLTDMITKGMGLDREEVYIANILKCRPPENRDPAPEESASCYPYLDRQIAIIRPEYLCLLGRVAAQMMLETTLSMTRLRGRWYRYRGIPTVVTFHPAYLLRNPASKKEAWEDLQMLMNAMGLAVARPSKDRT